MTGSSNSGKSATKLQLLLRQGQFFIHSVFSSSMLLVRGNAACFAYPATFHMNSCSTLRSGAASIVIAVLVDIRQSHTNVDRRLPLEFVL